MSIIGFIFAPNLISVFRDDSDVIAAGAKALRYQCIIMPVLGYCTTTNMLMQSLKLPLKATVLALSRQGIFYIPLILLLPRFMSETGIMITMPIADALSFILTFILSTSTIKKLKQKAKQN